ncbi:ATP-dependent RNA helicase DbpA [Methanosarcinaceae archaeon Ag5]|uniref:ATP-dependent RNA helicase DbpA n=1 Tax=Methanolapillus africanus TaxID=3028297 RepID=A0AAE4MK31_9EURY|nr:ATP-dependent RNA helicase DbpA [Methanosarcinaceae archaeon Ag5]
MLWILFAGKGQKFTVMTILDKKKEPLWTGELELKENTAGFRPHKIRILKREGKELSDEEYIQSKEFINLLKKANRIMIATGCSAAQENELKSMLSAYQLKYEYVNICRFCLLQKRFNFINKSSIRYHKEMICPECAKDELKKVLKNSRQNMGDSTVDFFYETLLRTKDFDKTASLLSADRLDPEVTRYDTIRSAGSEKQFPVKKLRIHNRLKNLLLAKSDQLLPVQSMAVDAGLLDGKNLMVVSATATGKTLIGEIAGIENILSDKGKMLYLVPLVALANQKYDQFKKRYSEIGLSVSIRIGAELIKTKSTSDMKKSLDSDIIVGTYEGVDHILRLGNADSLGQVGTVVIDEVHMLTDSDRGHRLDGLIARLRYLFPETQFIYLSATVAGPEYFAEKLDSELVVYEHRPVPIERHLVFARDDEKIRLMAQLVKDEFNMKSSKGHRGQTIIFTNSRANCHTIAASLHAFGINSAYYHAGLNLAERKTIEHKFARGEISAIVTTAALAAGVDFPASQVIFESMAMGIEWLTVSDFLQMSGRAGRPDYHDRGIVVLMPVPGKSYSSGATGTEEEVAIALLKGGLLEEEFDYDEEEQLEELLASVSVTTSRSDLSKIQKSMFGDISENIMLIKLQKYKFIELGKEVKQTRLGQIASAYFLSVSKTYMIVDSINAGISPLHIITNLDFFTAASFKYAEQISKDLRMNLPSRVFQGAFMDIIFDGENLKDVSPKYQKLLLNFAADMFVCSCQESPYCGCAERKFSEKIILLRTKGLEPIEIIRKLEDDYGITAYAGDIFSYLEDAIRNLEAMELIAKNMNKNDVAKNAKELRLKIQG